MGDLAETYLNWAMEVIKTQSIVVINYVFVCERDREGEIVCSCQIEIARIFHSGLAHTRNIYEYYVSTCIGILSLSIYVHVLIRSRVFVEYNW